SFQMDSLNKNQKSLSGVKGTIKLTESSLPASFQMDSLNKNQKSLSGVKGTIKLTESSLPASFQMDSLNKNQGLLSGVKGTIKLTESSLPASFQTDSLNKNQGLLSGVKGTIKLTESSLPASFQMDSLNKNQGLLSGVKGTIKLTESSLPANFQMDSLNKNQGLLSGVKGTIKYTERGSLSGFKNLVAPKQIIENVFPYKKIDRHDVSNIFLGLSPSEYKLENDIKENKINTYFVKKETSEEIPVKSLVSTIGAGDLLRNIKKEEVISFYLYLSKYPMLGLEHRVGQRILTELDKVKIINVQNKVLYRARPRDPKKRENPYSSDEMFAAPFGVSGQGRFNVVGQGELYTCDKKEIAVKECVKEENVTVDVIEWELIENIKLIDLTDIDSPLVQYCSFSAVTSSGLEYLVPNFIAQCAKSKGIDGIVFISNQKSDALNYVFFDHQKKWFKTLGLYEVISS
ncbi:RES family NAD+ phosphorylase, partial [Bacillus cereus]|uniref:RES family NAD+ phosphorylase n=1 Tax=Bacillus cereus TaxID=1396 RepID=UPI003D648EA9